jgi:2-dehydropantoate 2-reductase
MGEARASPIRFRALAPPHTSRYGAAQSGGPDMKIAAMAAGAVGSYFGGRMQAAGHDVAYIARRAHLDALRKDGLKIQSTHGDLHLPKVNATPDPKEVGPVDIVLFAVKLWDTETAAELARPLVGPNTRIITLQNGVDSYERVSAILGKEHTSPGTAYIAAVLGGPGVMLHTSKFATMRCGTIDGRPDAQLNAFVEAAKAAGIDIQPQEDMNRERWQKFIFLSSMAGVNCMMRQPIGTVLADPDTRAFYKRLMQECLAVGQKSGAKVPSSWVDDRMTFSDNAPPGMKASMLHDLEAGNRLELDWLTGKVVELGRTLGVPTPASETIYAVLKLHRMGKT